MYDTEPKKLALLRILQILEKYSDCDHPMTQKDIAERLEKDYGIELERKAIGRNISLLEEADIDLESTGAGTYICGRTFEDSELRLLIDGVLSSRHISGADSEDLIKRICSLSNEYFRSNVQYIYSVREWSKTDNRALFYNIEVIDSAIKAGRQIHFTYSKYGIDKKLHPASEHDVSPYQMVLHSQKYYLMAFNERFKEMVYYHVDRITDIRILEDRSSTPIRQVKGYINGINYRELSTAMPYMYSDQPERINFTAESWTIDQIVEWFGDECTITRCKDDKDKVNVSVFASPLAMEHWALQYLNYVEITSPVSLRDKIRGMLENGLGKYS